MPMIKIICNPSEIQSLAGDWNQLAEGFGTPLLYNEWFAACAEAYHQPGQLCVVVNKSRHGIDAIAPLVLAENRGFKVLEFLGSSFLFEPGGMIYRDEESLEELMNAVIGIGKPVILDRFKSESLEIVMLKKINKRRFFCISRDCQGSPFLQITGTWPEFEANMSSRSRYDLRRARRRAETMGDIRFEILSPDPAATDRYFEEFCQVEASGWKGREGTAILMDKRMKHFLSIYARSASRLGALRLCFLRINDKAAAALLGIEYFGSFWVLKTGYDETFSRCSPGILLLHETIRYSYTHGLKVYEFLGTDESWMHIWTGQQHSYSSIRVYPISIIGQLKFGLDISLAIFNRASKMVRRIEK